MENISVVDEKTEELLKEADSIYGFEKSKNVLYNYAHYIDMRKNNEIRFGNYNVLIRDNSAYDSSDQLLNLLIKLLKEKQVTNTKFKYLEEEEIKEETRSRRNRRKDDEKKEELKEDILIINTKRKDISVRYIRRDLREMMKKYTNKIFIIIDGDEMRGSTNADFGDLISWTMEIEKISSENKMDYINKYFKKNKIKLDKRNTFVESLAEEPFWKVKNEIINILTECKMKNITKITDDVIKKELKLKYVSKKINIEKRDPTKELNKLIGIDEVKKQVNQIINYVSVNKTRGNMPMLHMCFEGNPGTGKTTVARIIGEIFKQKNILSKKGKFVEAQRGDLIGKYVGWTAKQTQEVVQEAEGGVLFIDEAYNISPKGSDVDYGHECIATLIKEMEDKRDNLCVILAGYTKEMEELLKTNPGFESRIQFKIKFPDYTEEELYLIFKQMCKNENYKMSSNVKESLLKYFSEEKKKDNFSNGRCVRNIFEKIKFEQADRVSKDKNADINLIIKQDVEELTKTPVEENKKIKLGFAC